VAELGPRRPWVADLKQYISVYCLGPKLLQTRGHTRCLWTRAGSLGSEGEPSSFSPFLCSFTEPVVQPTLQADSTTVTEAGSVTLTCLSEDPGLSIRWFFNHQGLYFNDRMTLSQKNSRLSIDRARWEDAGEYQCEVSNGYSSKMSLPVQISVVSE